MKPLLIAVAFWLAAANASQAARAVADVIHPPAVHYRLRVLPNGLKVYSVVDHSTANVAVQVWYDVGAKNDPPGRSGFAHLFEHLMFKGTRDMPPEFIDRLTEDVGGYNNASTDEDYTEYDEVVPSAHLERLLWAEASRMGSLVVDQASFTSERSVVEQELRQEVAADPYDRLLEFDAPQASFALPSNRRPVLGSIADLEAATLGEVKAFHSLYYRPDDATLIVVGNFDPHQLDTWVDKYFGPLARPATPLPRVAAREPARVARQRTDVYAPSAPLPAVVLTYAGPNADSSDAAAVKVLDAILDMGDSSRLYSALVVHRRLADEVLSDVDLRQQAGLIEVGLVMADGAKAASGEAALLAQLGRLRQRRVTQGELARAKIQLLVELLQDRETIEGIANAIGEAAVVEGDAARVNSSVRALQAVTPAALQRAARSYLVDSRRVTIRFHPAREPILRRTPAQSSRAPSPVGSTPTLTAMDRVERRAPAALPRVGPAIGPIAPKVFERTLANGLRVIVAHTGLQPLATASLTFRGGSALDPPRQAGLAHLTAAMAADGAGGRSAQTLAGSADALSEQLSNATDYDSTSFTLQGLSLALPEGLRFLATVVRAAPREAELRSSRLQIEGDLAASTNDEESISEAAVAPLVFGGGPYGHSPSGDPRSLARIGLADVVRERARLYRPDNAVLVLSGDVEPARAFALAERLFRNWRRPPGSPPRPPAITRSPVAGRVVAIDLPGVEEARVTLAGRSSGRLDPSFEATEVANALFGGGYSSRLNAEIRTKLGLTYGASSEMIGYLGAGVFTATAQVQGNRAAEVATRMLHQLEGLGRAPPARDELAARKADLVGRRVRDTETDADMADLLTDAALYSGDVGEVGRYPATVAAITRRDVQAAAARLSDASHIDVLVVGDASQFLPALRARFANVEVLPARALAAGGLSLKVSSPAIPGSGSEGSPR